jgi:hypothetical protein
MPRKLIRAALVGGIGFLAIVAAIEARQHDSPVEECQALSSPSTPTVCD